MNNSIQLGHKFDVQVSLDAPHNALQTHDLYAEQCELAVGIATTNSCGGGFDCAGTVGSAGSVGGCLGTFGTFGCCC